MAITLSTLTLNSTPDKSCNNIKFSFRSSRLVGFYSYLKFNALQITDSIFNRLKRF